MLYPGRKSDSCSRTHIHTHSLPLLIYFAFNINSVFSLYHTRQTCHDQVASIDVEREN